MSGSPTSPSIQCSMGSSPVGVQYTFNYKFPCVSVQVAQSVWRIGRVDAFRPKGHVFDSRSNRHVGTLVKSLTHNYCLWRFGVKFRHSIRAVSGPPLSSVDVKRRYINGLNE